MKLAKSLYIIIATCIVAAGAIFVSIYYIPHFSPEQPHSDSRVNELKKMQ